MTDEAAWTRLAAEIKWRLSQLGWNQKDLAEHAGVTPRTVSTLLSGKPRGREPLSIPAIERAIGWEPGSVQRTLSDAEYFPSATDQARDLATQHELAKAADEWYDKTLDAHEALTLIALLRSALDRLPIDSDMHETIAYAVRDLEWKIEHAVGDAETKRRDDPA